MAANLHDARATDVLIVGAGAAGLVAALAAAPRRVTLLAKARPGAGAASAWAQGGVAAAVGEDDSPALHAEDTLAAGAGLCDPEAVLRLAEEGPRRIAQLAGWGVRFDRVNRRGGPRGAFALGREAAHSRRRILHAHDATGAELVRALAAAVSASAHIRLVEATAEELMVDGGRMLGVWARGADGRRALVVAGATVLATGGVGHLYSHTTNPPEATGDGLAMAARAGAVLVDLEMVQFHPTALAVGADPMPLLTEALRGEGALLVDSAGRRFMIDEHPAAELAPRDVVARAIWRRLRAGEEVFLDARGLGSDLAARFPTVFAAALSHGLDGRRELLPVAAAAHYHMGGVAVDLEGRTSLPGLWACGEVASTGVDGANRLASNSLLEAVVYGARAGEALRRELPERAAARRALAAGPPPAADSSGSAGEEGLVGEVRRLMWRDVGLERDGVGLRGALARLAEIQAQALRPRTRNLTTVARLVTAAALARRESRGAHFRADFPHPLPEWRRRLRFLLGADGALVPVAGEEAPAATSGRGGRR